MTTTSNDPDEIRADIERTRTELSYNVDELTDTANPKKMAHRQTDHVKGKVKDAVGGVKDKIMGSDDPADSGAIGNGRAAARDRTTAVGDAVSGAPGQVKDKTRGNPLGAGLVAFGVGLLISSLIPSSQKEQQAVSDLQQKLEPLKAKAADAAKEIGDNLREPAQQAVAAVKDQASDSAGNVKGEGVAAKEQVRGQAADAKDTVQQQSG